MKKLYLLLLPGLGILFGLYSFFAARTVRGIGVYTLSSGMGQFLTVSRHYTTAAAIILILVFAVILVSKIMKNRKKSTEPQPTQAADEPVPEETYGGQEAPEEKEVAEAVEAAAEETPCENEVPKCGKCGADLKEGAKFCEKCGEPVAQ